MRHRAGLEIKKREKFSLSHIFLLLLAIIPLVPLQIPTEFTSVQLPLYTNVPPRHERQSAGDGPLQFPHGGEQRAHSSPVL